LLFLLLLAPLLADAGGQISAPAVAKLVGLMLIDKHALIGVASVLASVAAVTLIHAAVIRDWLSLALSIQRTKRRAYFPASLLAVAMNLAVMAG
jgi:hypothetical protein